MSYSKTITLSLLWVLAVIVLVPTVSAYYEVMQGDIVYQDEIVDLSRVISFSGELAYFNSGEYGTTPSKTINAYTYGNLYAFKIQKEVFPVGNFFKWDGEYHRGENAFAFEVRSGTRINYSENQTMYPGKGTTPVPTSTPVPPAYIIPKETHLLLARGDQNNITYGIDWSLTKGSSQKGYIWLFGAKDSILGEEMVYTSSTSTNVYTFTPEKSQSLTPGWYTGVIQFSGMNGMKDAYYVAKHKLDDGYYHAILETPYDDEIIKDVPLEGFIPIRVSQELEKLLKPSLYADDIIIPITFELQEPSLMITDYWEESDDIVIQGTTNLAAGTRINLMLDPLQYPLVQDRLAHTYNTTAIKELTSGSLIPVNELKYIDNNGTPVMTSRSNPRTFSIRIPLPWGDLSIGRHVITASVEKYNITVSVDNEFDITGTWVEPTQPPIFRKVVVSSGGSHLIDNRTGQVLDSSGFPNGSTVTTVPTGSWNVDVNGNPIPATTRPVVTLVTPLPLPPTQAPNQGTISNSGSTVYVDPALHPNVNTSSNVRPTILSTPPPPTPVPTPTDDVVIPVSPVIALIGLAIVVLIKKR